MDHDPPAVGLTTEHDGLDLVLGFPAGIGSLSALDRLDQDGRIAENAKIDHARLHVVGYEGAVLGHPCVPRPTVLG
jgi:hypothetical protein